MGLVMDGDVEALELELMLDALARRWGYDFRSYARSSLSRRVREAQESEGVPSVSALQHLLLRDLEALSRFVAKISVRSTAMFRDPALFRVFRAQVVPLLRTYPFVRIWSAGCSTGEEVYSLAILLHEEGLYERARIYATDLSDDLLQRAIRGVYPLHALEEHESAYVAAGGRGGLLEHFTADGESAIVRHHLRKNLVFSQHNLVSDGSFNEFHVVFCRNVMIYFDDALRERVHALLGESLTRFGVLALGMKESLRHTSVVEQYRPIDEEVRLYRRLS